MTEAVRRTFAGRRTPIAADAPIGLTPAYWENPSRPAQVRAFARRAGLAVPDDPGEGFVGLLGAFLVISAFKPSLQLLACVAGLASMIAFVMLAYAAGDFGEALRKVVAADIVGSIGLIVVLALRKWVPAAARAR